MSLDNFKTEKSRNNSGKATRGISSTREYTDEELIDMYKTGLSTREVANKSTVGQSQVSRILNKHDINTRTHANTLDQLNLDDEETYSYIISVLACDGSVYSSGNYTYRAALNVIDYEFAKQFRDKCEEFGFHTYCQELNKEDGNHKDQMKVNISHKEFYEHWESLSPDDKKSIWLKNEDTMVAFLKGAYESEGSIWKSTGLVLEISNEQNCVIESIFEAGEHFGFNFTVKSTKPTSTGGTMRKLAISKRDEVKRFIQFISPCIKQTPR